MSRYTCNDLSFLRSPVKSLSFLFFSYQFLFLIILVLQSSHYSFFFLFYPHKSLKRRQLVNGPVAWQLPQRHSVSSDKFKVTDHAALAVKEPRSATQYTFVLTVISFLLVHGIYITQFQVSHGNPQDDSFN